MNATLRIRKNKKKDAIYADIYYNSETRKKVTLGQLYKSPCNEKEKERNRKTLEDAENYVDNINNSNNPYESSSISDYDLNSSFSLFFQEIAAKSKGSQQSSSLIHFNKFCKRFKKVTFWEIDTEFCQKFHDYLFYEAIGRGKKSLNPNTALAYFEKFCSIVNEAVDHKIFRDNPLNLMKNRRKYKQPKREYLTPVELARAEATDCEVGSIKEAFLFSCYCGLRFSDVKGLRLINVYQVEKNSYELNLNVNKNTEWLTIPLNNKSYNIIKERMMSGNRSDRLFPDLKYVNVTKILSSWLKKADIYKHITFHCSRHSFASNLIQKGGHLTDIRDLLGHKNIKTTEIYAKTSAGSRRKTSSLLDD